MGAAPGASRILLITSSPRGEASLSTRLARALAGRLAAASPHALLTARDLAVVPLPHIGADFISGRVLPCGERNSAQAAAVEVSDRLIAEVLAHDVIVIGSGMINFSLSTNLKSWFDHMLRAGTSFRYVDGRVEGLLGGRTVWLVQARGNDYRHAPVSANDFQQPLAEALLGYMGLGPDHVITAEGVAFSEGDAEAGALLRIDALLASASG